jgi:hypothetical protein
MPGLVYTEGSEGAALAAWTATTLEGSSSLVCRHRQDQRQLSEKTYVMIDSVGRSKGKAFVKAYFFLVVLLRLQMGN